MIYLAPAYGRSYKKLDDLIQAWTEGSDFKIISGAWAGAYTSIRDSKELKKEGMIVLICPRGGFEVRLAE